MIKKYEKLNRDIFNYIENRIALNLNVMTISREVIEKFPTWIIFTKVEPEMQLEIIEQLVKQSFWINQNRPSLNTSLDNLEKK